MSDPDDILKVYWVDSAAEAKKIKELSMRYLQNSKQNQSRVTSVLKIFALCEIQERYRALLHRFPLVGPTGPPRKALRTSVWRGNVKSVAFSTHTSTLVS
jgi:hypothetical protein